MTTGSPFYYLFEDAGFEVMLVNARQVKDLPGRKTDVSDAEWLAQLAAHGLIRRRRSCRRPQIRQLRDLTRYRVDADPGTRPGDRNGWRRCWS